MSKRILHYELGKKIGRGGMGEVYLARDTRLDRDVAIKFVPESQTADEGLRSRFEREARAASKLIHPNIVAIHSFERAEGRDFIVMEYVPGRSLGDVIAAGNLSLDHAVKYAREIADALQAAHAQGVVHRDIKPDNVVITKDGHAKVLDFGLATIEGATRITKSSTSVGTLAYMSPEQLQGGDVDHRTDLFALGVVLYEMITGRLPFQGEHQAAMTYAIINADPEPLARYKANIRDDLQRIIDKALRKNVGQRYQSAADFRADLDVLSGSSQSQIGWQSGVSGSGAGRSSLSPTPARAKRPAAALIIGIVVTVAIVMLAGIYFIAGPGRRGGDKTAATPSGRIMVAVLPFQNMGSPDDEYFADGVTEEIIARLASITSLGVIARTSVLRYKDTERPIADIGHELGVDYVLEGTVRWQHAGDGTSDVRVTPQLIRVNDETHVWADVYDQPLDAVFRVQTEIAQQVTQALDLRLGGSESAALAKVPTENIQAYDLYLRGVHTYFAVTVPEDNQRAEELLKKAIEIDPNFVEAYARLSGVYSQRGWYWGVTDETTQLSEQYARKAIAIDPGSYGAKMAWGYYLYHGLLDYDGALKEFNDALRIRPSSTEATAAIGFVQRRQGKWEECLAALKQALDFDPQSPEKLQETAETLVDMGRYDEAQRYLDRTFAVAPGFAPAMFWQFRLHLLQGNLDAARRVLQTPGFSEPFVPQLEALLRVYERNYDGALEIYATLSEPALDNHFIYYPVEMLIGGALRLNGDPGEAKPHYESAASLLEDEIAERPDDARLYGALGITLAGLDRKDEAIAAAKRGVEMLPVAKEAKRGPARVFELAEVYAMVGEYELALDQLESVMSHPAAPTDVGLMKLQPVWDPLRGNSRFQKLVGE